MTVLERMGEWASAAGAGSLPQAARQQLAVHLLDAVGAWIAGRATEEGARLAALQSTVPGQPVSLLAAEPLDGIALAVATTRLTEIDDIHMPSCVTPSAVVAPVALILASRLSRPGAQAFAQALNAGYEVMTRLGVAVAGPEILYRGIWPTYLTAPAGAAAVAARLLGLDASKTADALAIAITLAGTSPGTPGSASPRWLLLGLAARAGCAAALAAAQGYTGDRKLLDGDWMLRAHGVHCDSAPLVAPSPEPGAVAAVSLKPYCAAKQSMAAIEAFRELLVQGVSPEEITAVEVGVPPAYAGMIGRRDPASGRVARITCAAYHLALAAYRPDALDDVARPNLATDSRIAAFMKRVEVVSDEALTRHYPERWPARVEVSLKGGRVLSHTVLDTRGDPGNTSEFSARDKFHRLADAAVGRHAAERIAEACLRAVECDEGLAALFASLRSEQILD